MRKTGDEPIEFRGKDTGLRLRDFWSWGFSDLLDNTLRGSYAEFIVAAALGIDLSEARVNWEPWDLMLDGIRVEVKSCSYLQAWEQTRPSDIKFSIRPAIQWTATEAGPVSSAGSQTCTSSACSLRRTRRWLTRCGWIAGRSTSSLPECWMSTAESRSPSA